MKTKITLLFLMFQSIIYSQTTYTIDWFTGVSVEDASVTIEVGDTVEWIWMDSLPHTVSSDSDAAEEFDSGTITGIGETFSYTFTIVGENGYECEIHSTMDGVITVVPNLGIEDKFRMNLNHYPNPVTNELTVTSLIDLNRYEVYDLQGKLIKKDSTNANYLTIDFSNNAPGVYFVRVYSNGLSETLKVIRN